MIEEYNQTQNVPATEGQIEEIYHSGSAGKDKKELAYTNKFADFVKSHKGFLIKTKKVVDSIFDLPENEELVVHDIDNVKVEYLGWHGTDNRKYFKVSTDGIDFFLKVNSLKNPSGHVGKGEDGVQELLIMKKIKEILKEFREFPVSVVDYQIAYRDDSRAYTISLYDERLKTTVQGDLSLLDKNIKNIEKEYQGSHKDIVKRLIGFAKTRDWSNKLYYGNLYIGKRFNNERVAKADLVLNETNAKIDKISKQALEQDENISKLIQLIQARGDLMKKYYSLLYFLDSKKMAHDFHPGQMSFDGVKNEITLFDLREGGYIDPEDFIPDPDFMATMNLIDSVQLADNHK